MTVLSEEAVREKKLAALASVGSALLLVSLKVFLAIVTGSLGILSEALHSGLDLITTIITYLSVRVADKPADADHTYGHGKVENFSAFIETGLLILASLYIIYEAFHRLLFKGVHIEPSLAAIGILGLTLGVDYLRSRALRRVAEKYQSEALEADALHFSTDLWSTLVVMAGIGAVWAGQQTGLAWLRYADPLAALVVAGVIIWVGSQLGKRTLDALLDAAPLGLQQRIATAVTGVEGVLDVSRVRLRRAGNRYFVDVTISVPRTNSFEQVHATSEAVEDRVRQIVPADVMVHMEPQAPAGEHLFDRIRALAQRRGLDIHELSAHQTNGAVFVELHLEVDERLPLAEAHRRATELEEQILREVEGVSEAVIHIEPVGTAIPAAAELTELAAQIQQHINDLRSEFRELVDCHQVKVRQVEHRIVVTCHCVMQPELPVGQMHDITAAIEDCVKEKFPQVFRLTIHPEPVGEG
jgi:cation diffusion facilitator family transporter